MMPGTGSAHLNLKPLAHQIRQISHRGHVHLVRLGHVRPPPVGPAQPVGVIHPPQQPPLTMPTQPASVAVPFCRYRGGSLA